MNNPLLIRNLPKNIQKQTKYNINLINKNIKCTKLNYDLNEELNLYKSLFKTHHNSVVFNLKIKKRNGKKVWTDRISDNRSFIESLDKDEEVEEWLKHVKCER